MIYGLRSNGSQHGLVLTKPAVVNAMLDRVGYSEYADLRHIRVIEPAAGDGAFATAIIDRLYTSSVKFEFSFEDALQNLVFFEIDKNICDQLNARIAGQLAGYQIDMPEGLIRKEDFLLSAISKSDLIVGNPPYVRHENIPEAQKKIYRGKFSTFRHRSDLYIAFYEKGLGLLKEGGVLSFICSNRWLKNQYGKSLRSLIGLSYSMEEIIDLEDANPFEETVIAYPAITTIRKVQGKGVTAYYQARNAQDLTHLDAKIQPTSTLNTNNPVNWFISNNIDSVNNSSFEFIEKQGFKIGIGVASGADSVFIRTDFKSIVEEELLIPILMSRDIKNDRLEWRGNYIINPYKPDGKLIDLNYYPKAKKYFDAYREILEKRYLSKKRPDLWYKTIDRIYPSLVGIDKIILPDISGNSYLFIDTGQFYPHHNLYYITGPNRTKLILLAVLLMSDFVREQLGCFGNKMNGGYPRWQSQNLKKLRLPIIDSIPAEVAEVLVQAYYARDYDVINKWVTVEEISNYKNTAGQMVLF